MEYGCLRLLYGLPAFIVQSGMLRRLFQHDTSLPCGCCRCFFHSFPCELRCIRVAGCWCGKRHVWTPDDDDGAGIVCEELRSTLYQALGTEQLLSRAGGCSRKTQESGSIQLTRLLRLALKEITRVIIEWNRDLAVFLSFRAFFSAGRPGRPWLSLLHIIFGAGI